MKTEVFLNKLNILEYDTNLISREGNYGQMALLTGDQYIRIGIFGYNNGIQERY